MAVDKLHDDVPRTGSHLPADVRRPPHGGNLALCGAMACRGVSGVRNSEVCGILVPYGGRLRSPGHRAERALPQHRVVNVQVPPRHTRTVFLAKQPLLNYSSACSTAPHPSTLAVRSEYPGRFGTRRPGAASGSHLWASCLQAERGNLLFVQRGHCSRSTYIVRRKRNVETKKSARTASSVETAENRRNGDVRSSGGGIGMASVSLSYLARRLESRQLLDLQFFARHVRSIAEWLCARC